MELADIKLYSHVDNSDEDTLIQSFIVSAQEYIKNVTGKTFAETNELYDLAVKMLVDHWYNNRGAATDKSVNDMPFTLSTIINHLSLCGKYV